MNTLFLIEIDLLDVDPFKTNNVHSIIVLTGYVDCFFFNILISKLSITNSNLLQGIKECQPKICLASGLKIKIFSKT